MLELDGSEGGGQLVRTALTLSVLSDTPFTMTGIRGGRRKPGLKPQHLAAVETLAEISDATVSDAELGSEKLTFEPSRLQGGHYEVDIGTAGSIPLLFDSLLPLTTQLDELLTVRARGGTDVKWSPPMDYVRLVKLPLLRRWGLIATVDLARRGYYPKGGGDATLTLAPSVLLPPSVIERGELRGVRVYSVASADLAGSDVAERQTDEATRLLEPTVGILERSVTYSASASAGSAVVVRLDFDQTLAGFGTLGERGKPAEAVAGDAVELAQSWLDGPGAVDARLADQLVVPLALCGGEVTIPMVTDHLESNVEVVRAFGYEVSIVDDPLRVAGTALC